MKKQSILKIFSLLFCSIASSPLSSNDTISSTIQFKEQHNPANMNTLLTIEQLIEAQEQIDHLLRSEEAALEMIRDSHLPIMVKWQNFLAIILPIQIKVIKAFGFTADQKGLSQFNLQYTTRAAENLSLRELNHRKWSFLFEKTFGLNSIRQLSLDEARNLIDDIATAMMDKEFLQKIDEAMAKIPDETSMAVRRQELLTILFPLHMRIMSKYGFDGEEGYLQAHRAVMDHYHDPFIIKRSTQAQMLIFERAHLI